VNGAIVTDRSTKTRSRSLPWFSLAVLAVVLVCAAFAPLLTSHSPTEIDLRNAKLPPGGPSDHLLGTDTLGRDVLARLIYGARTSVFIALIGLGSSAIVGTLLGVLSGYFGGRLDAFLMRVVDIGLAFPSILAALVIAMFMGVGILTVLLAVTVTMWAKFARMIRGSVLEVQGRDFVTLAKIAGVSTPTIIWRHIMPNVVNTLMVVASLLLGEVILLEAALSFLGLGLPPGAPAWGIMVAEGRALLTTVWWLSLFPGVAITIVVLAMNVLGDWLRDALDPRLRQL
jgi:peptide/nickel transport system permease protein